MLSSTELASSSVKKNIVLASLLLWVLLYPFGEVMHVAALPIFYLSVVDIFKKRLKFGKMTRCYFIVGFLLIGPLFLTLFSALEVQRHGDTIILWVCYFIIGIYFVNNQVDYEFYRKVVIGVAAIVLFLAFDGLLQFFIGFNSFGFPLEGGRVTGMFHPRFRLGNDLAHLSPFVFEAIRHYGRKGKWQSFAWLLVVPLALVIFLSGNRSGWIVFFLVSLGYGGYLLYIREFPVKAFSAVFLVFAVAFVGILNTSPTMADRLERSLRAFSFSSEDVDYASSSRLAVYNAAIDVIKEYPLLGVGRRGMDTALEGMGVNATAIIGQGIGHAHLFALDVPLHVGVVGVVPYLLAMFMLILLLIKAVQSKQSLPFAACLASFLAINPINMHYSFYDVRHSSLFWLLIALAFMASRLKTRNT